MPSKPAHERLRALLRNTNATTTRQELLQWPAQEVAEAVMHLPPVDQTRALRILPPRAAGVVFELLTIPAQRTLLPLLPQSEPAVWLNDLAPDDRMLFLSELPATAARPLMAFLADEERTRTQRLLAHPSESVGRLMTTDYVAIREDWSIQDVLAHIREHGRDSEALDILYVIDDHGRLHGDVRLRELLLAADTARVADLLNRRLTALHTADSQRAAVQMFRREDRTALPVVNADGVLIGTVAVDDVLNASQEMATRDLQRVGGSEALGEPYLTISAARMFRKRAGWLVVLFLGETLTATAMRFFEQDIARAVVLALFVPLIISSGGNSGSQASTLVIWALAIGEVTLRDWRRVARRELVSGLALGSLLGTIGFLRIAGWSLISDLYGPHWLLIAFTVSAALVGVVLWGVLIGAMLPFALRRFGFDPATSSAPFVATLVDVTGLLIYFSIAVAVLQGSVL